MKRYGSREICNVVFKDITTGEPKLYLDSLKISSLEQTATTVYARGGRGNPRLIGWSSDKDIVFNCEDALISPESLAVLAGTTVSSAATSAHLKEVFVIGTTTGAATTGVTVTETPVTGMVTGIFIYVASNAYSISTGSYLTWTTAGTGTACYTMTGTHFALGTATVATGDYLIVDYYFTATGTKIITLASDTFAGYYKIEADTLWRDEITGTDYPAIFTMPKVKLKDNWSIPMENTGDPKTFNFQIDVFKEASTTKMVTIQVLEGT